MYYSISLFISRSMKHFNQLKDKKVILPDKTLTLEDFKNDEVQ